MANESSVTSQSFTLHPATRDDIPRLAEIHVIACLPDNAFKLYFSTAAEFNQRVTEMLSGQVGDLSWQHVKAIDTISGQIAAWASWHTPPDTKLREEATHHDAAQTKDSQPGKGEFDFPPGLPAFVQADTDRWLKRVTHRRRHMQCKALFTDPLFQQRGMGSALVGYGNQIADTQNLPIFLQASPYGFPVYEKFGFVAMQVLDVDLCEWAPDAKSNDKGFGTYRFRYMLRLPKTLPEDQMAAESGSQLIHGITTK